MAVVTLLLATAAAQAITPAPSCAERLLPPDAVEVAGKRAVTPADLIELRDFGDPAQDPSMDSPFALSPDRGHVAVALRRADIGRNDYCYGILLLSLADGTRRLLDTGGEPLIASSDYFTRADKANGVVVSSPLAWSPDGRWIAFLRRRQGTTQVWRVPVGGGAAEQVTNASVDVRRFSWNADGTAIRFTTRPGVEAAITDITEEGQDGFLFDDRFWPLSADHPLPRSSIPYVEQQIDLLSGAVSPVADPAATPFGDSKPAVNPWRQELQAWLAPDNPASAFSPSRLHIGSASNEMVCGDPACRDVVGFWWEDDGTILFLSDGKFRQQGLLAFYRWRINEPAPDRLWQTEALLFGCVPIARSLLCGQETADRPRQLVLVSVDTGEITEVFDPNPEWAGIRTGRTETFTVTSADGAPTIARLLLPPSHRNGERHPLVIVQYTSRGFLRGGTGDEYPMHLLAELGFAVLSFHKPRAPGADLASPDLDTYLRANLSGLAERKRIFTALDAAIDVAIEGDSVDPDRIAITGLSDGASTVAYALLHSSRYSAAILSTCCDEPSFTQFQSGPAYAEIVGKYGYPHYGEIGFWSDYSLALNADRADLPPILIQAADEEFRMALETMAALRNADRPVEMYVFPGEMHVKWQPRHRAAIYRRNAQWLKFWFYGEGAGDPVYSAQYQRWETLCRSYVEGLRSSGDTADRERAEGQRCSLLSRN